MVDNKLNMENTFVLKLILNISFFQWHGKTTLLVQENENV